MIKKFLKNNITVFTILSIIIFWVFGQLIYTFYQQDEWYGLGLIISKGINFIFDGVSNPLDPLFAKGRILSGLVYFSLTTFFPLQNTPLAIFSILLHLLTTILVFTVIEKFIKDKLLSLVGAVFFAVNSVSHGAITWPMVAIGVIPSTILIILSTVLFLKFLNKKGKRWLIFSAIMIYLSLWFRETGLYMYLFLPLSALLLKRYSLATFFKTYWVFILPFLLITSYRIIGLYFMKGSANLYITGQNENFFSILLLRSLFYPLTSFSLMFVPGDNFLEFARMVLRQIYSFFAYSDQNILIAQTVILDFLAMILTFTIAMILILLSVKEQLILNKQLLFWTLFSLMSFLPYIIVSKDFSYLESRYYYLSLVGGACILTWFLKRIKEISNPRIFFILVLPICIVYLMFHAISVQRAISEQVKLSDIRKNFINDLKSLVPTLENNKNIFYITSDTNFWVDGNKIPFQQGSGYTLMVLYYDSGKIPKEFFQPQRYLNEGFLFGIGSQGYIEKGEFGFGYFWDKKQLEDTVKMYNLQERFIISLRYDSDSRELKKQ